MSVFLQDDTTLEAEPNNTLSTAHVLGDVAAGESISIFGSVQETGTDTADVFELRAPERIVVDIALDAISPSSDLDLFVLDGVSQQVVQRYITANASETGRFVAQGTFYLVVDSFSQDSDYDLTVTVSSVPAAIAEIEPNDTAQNGNYFGVLGSAASPVRIAGDGAGGSSDFFLAAVSGGAGLTFDLTSAAGNDYDVLVYDGTSDIANPTLLGSFETSGNTESGFQAASAMSLLAVEVRPFGGATAAYTLDLSSGVLRAAADMAGLSAAPRATVFGDDAAAARVENALAGVLAPAAPVLAGDIIVQRTPGARRAPTGVDAGAEVVAAMPGGPEKLHFDLDPSLSPEDAARYTIALSAAMRAEGGVEFAEPDYLLQALALPQERRPNDPFYNLQWHYEQINLPAAWDITTGSNSVRVAILDTGSAPSSDLAPREVAGIDMISSASIAGDGDGIDNDPTDVGDGINGPQPSSFHGAHVAGTVGAVTDNGSGVAGVTWLGQIMHVRVLGIGGGSSFDIAQGVLYAAGLSNASGQVASPAVDIINMSLGGPGFSQTFQNAVTDARNAGSLVIAAAGNENSSTPSFPAAYDGVVSVAAVDLEQRRAPYSNFHPTVDIAAPGGDVSADRNGDGYGDGVLSPKPDDSVSPTNFESYSFYQGTSMAAPHVAGVAALMLAVDPTLTPAQMESILSTTATDLGTPGRDTRFGDGLVNALAAVQQAAGGAGTTPVLALDRSSVLLDAAGSASRVIVSNIGAGSLSVTNVSVSTNSGGSWLSATPNAAPGAGSTDTVSIDISASTGGLADGSYTGSVEIQSNGGTQSVGVTLVVGGGGQVPTFRVFVIAVDANSFESLAQDDVLTNGSLQYSLPGLNAGEYLVVAGTDEDNDGFICDEGEPLCGIYPSLELAETISVDVNQGVGGLDFPLQESVIPSSSSGERRGFRLLRGADDADVQAASNDQEVR